MNKDFLRTNLMRHMREENVTRRIFAQRVGICRHTIYSILNGNCEIRISTMILICEATGWTFERLLSNPDGKSEDVDKKTRVRHKEDVVTLPSGFCNKKAWERET